MEWAVLPLHRYADFSGRARRLEYWGFHLLTYLIILGFLAVDAMVMTIGLADLPFFTAFASLALLVPNFAVAVRRLHDTAHSGWWLLVALFPGVGGLLLLVFMLIEGTHGPNRYGEDPKDAGAVDERSYA